MTGFANFYAEFTDSLLMNAGFLAPCLLVCWLGRFNVVLLELVLVGGSTHLRYTNNMSMMYFFEWDLLDLIFAKPRLVTYHAHHHDTVKEHFSVFNMVSDETIRNIFHWLSSKADPGSRL